MKQITPTQEGALFQFDVGDGKREVCIVPRMFNATITIGPIGEDSYTEHWCYENPVQAVLAAAEWNPLETQEPEGWFRHARSGRRRPGGDPEKEYVAL